MGKAYKKIHFHYIRDVIIVPTREEYLEQNIWWSENDYTSFKQSAINEILALTRIHKTVTLHKALSLLYGVNNNSNSNMNYKLVF